jgi:hypothetical protein
MDAGVATAENLALIRERGMDYVCVSRSRPREVPRGERTVLKDDSVEDSFRSLKSELGLRPSSHRVDRRLEGHIFITVCAYHLLAAIQRELRKHEIIHRWETIRSLMRTQCRVTVSMTNSEGDRIHIRQTTEAGPFHQKVYRALGLPMKPLKPMKTVS